MQTPLKIAFRNLERTPALDNAVREHADKLERYYDGIIGCNVVVEERHKHHRHGNHFHVRVELTVPGATLVAGREPDEHHAYADAYVAIRDAFSMMRRQLEDYARRQDRRVKEHAVPLHGRVSELAPARGDGRIATPDGRTIYFHRNSLVGADFSDIRIGTEVRFDEEEGDRGPQASSVRLVGKHHIVGGEGR
jgi:ribosomal subunit interface protein